MKRKIVVFTDNRAEYGALKNTMKRIRDSKKLELYIVVTGAHLLNKYGYTLGEIENDGFYIHDSIELQDDLDRETRLAKEMGNLMIKLTDTLAKINPDILLLFGDRYEMLAAASTAVGMHIPIAHISGGESTEGAIDEQIRHAITKMAHIHFPGATVYAENIRRMGEEAWRVFDVGDPGIENIKNTEILKKSELEAELNVKIDKRTLLVTYHPVTLEIAELELQIDNLIEALCNYDGSIVITYPNSDEGNELIIRKWKEFAKGRERICLVESLGSVRYLSLMSCCGAVVGNSSSAIVEAPYLKVPVVNIGNRQRGRLMADSIICCGYCHQDIETAIAKALSPEFAEIVERSKSLYGEGNTSEKIVEILENIEIDDKLFKKKLCWSK